jgi:Pyridoxamine 5'-phosphate oxidase
MAKVYESITDELHDFICKQHVFFVASAPLDGNGHVNLSPKGLDSFRILSPNRVAYLDLTGSGNETSAHIHENGRITFMFCP